MNHINLPTDTPEKSTTGDKCPKCASAKTHAPRGRELDGCDHYICRTRVSPEFIITQSDLCRALEAKNRAEAELNLMKTAGIIEVSIRNPSVADFVRHWTARAEKAEAELAEVKRELQCCRDNNSDREDLLIYQRDSAEERLGVTQTKLGRWKLSSRNFEKRVQEAEIQNAKLKGLLDRAIDAAFDSYWNPRVIEQIRAELEAL